jgi:hypothetical protein
MTGLFVARSQLSIALGRFSPDGPWGYMARTLPDAPVRDTREEADADETAWRGQPS